MAETKDIVKAATGQLDEMLRFVSEVSAIASYSNNGMVTLNIPPIMTELATKIQTVKAVLEEIKETKEEE